MAECTETFVFKKRVFQMFKWSKTLAFAEIQTNFVAVFTKAYGWIYHVPSMPSTHPLFI